MPLRYSVPPESLARELREVARDASELIEALTTGLNYELRPDFPKQQLVEIASALSKIDNGTAEGCRASLEYARHRLPAIRREFLLGEEKETSTDHREIAPQATRGTSLDQRVRDVISSTATALDEYRRLATSEAPAAEQPSAETLSPSGLAGEPIEQSLELEAHLFDASNAFDKIVKPGSGRADDLRRRLKDSSSQNQMVRAELGMKKPVVDWLRRTTSSLRDFSSIIKASAEAIRVASDLTQEGVQIWSDLNKTCRIAIFTAINKTCDLADSFADKLDKNKRNTTEVEAKGKGTDPTCYDVFLLDVNLWDMSMPGGSIPYGLSSQIVVILNRAGILTLRALFEREGELPKLPKIGMKRLVTIRAILNAIRPLFDNMADFAEYNGRVLLIPTVMSREMMEGQLRSAAKSLWLEFVNDWRNGDISGI